MALIGIEAGSNVAQTKGPNSAVDAPIYSVVEEIVGYFSQPAQLSDSEAESGCLQYASRICAYSCFRMAALTASRMN